MISSKLSWKQDLRPNSYCTDVCHQQTTIVPQKMFPNLESNLTQIQKKYVISNAFCKSKLKNSCQIKSTMFSSLETSFLFVQVHTEDAGNDYMPSKILSVYLIMFFSGNYLCSSLVYTVTVQMLIVCNNHHLINAHNSRLKVPCIS